MRAASFPKDFWWGASTSSHQVEGNTHNDWSIWEKKNAQALAQQGAQRYQAMPEAADPATYISGQAADHYNRFAADFKLAHSLGHNAHRLSIEWSRIEPQPGHYDQKEIAHYQRVIKALHDNGLEPFITLWHFTLPVWAAEGGGWTNGALADAFARYAEVMVKALPSVTYWITLNEPMVYTGQVYWEGIWPPARYHDLGGYFPSIRHLIAAHRLAYETIKRINPKAMVGIAKHQLYFEAVNNTVFNKILKWPRHWWWNRYFLKRIEKYQDFIGINHYFHDRIDGGFGKNMNEKVSDMGWELYPEGLYWVVKEVSDFHKPIIITEHGLADAQDTQRAWFIEESLRWLSRAVKEGIDVRGYLHWSLLDNFEWADGFKFRFGLVAVDYKTQKRVIRQSARVYKKLIQKFTS